MVAVADHASCGDGSVGFRAAGVAIPHVYFDELLAVAGGYEWSPDIRSLAIGLGCVWLWCVALMPRVWYSRHGFGRAWQIFWARLLRERLTLWAIVIGAVVSVATATVWWHGGAHWRGLLSSLIGMTVGGGLIWVVRIIGRLVLGREAMGFGDVTLMAMIGAFLGWQACLVTFFLASIAAAVIGLTQLLANRQNEIRFGPFLSLGALVMGAGRRFGWGSVIILHRAGRCRP